MEKAPSLARAGEVLEHELKLVDHRVVVAGVVSGNGAELEA